MLGKQALDRRNLRHSDDPARRPRHAPNPGAWPFAAGAPLVQPWCGGGSPLVQAFGGLVQGGSGPGSPRAGGDRPDLPISATAAQTAGAGKCRNINVIAEEDIRGGLRPVSVASNRRVLRTRLARPSRRPRVGRLRAGGAFAALRAAQTRRPARRP